MLILGRKDDECCGLVTCQKLNGGGLLLSMLVCLVASWNLRASSHEVSSPKSQL